MRTLLLQSIPKDIARVYLIQSVNGLIKINYLVRPLSSIYILQLFTCIKIPVSFDDFEQFAKNIVYLMEWQVDVLSTVRKMNKVTTGNTRNHIISVQDTPEKKKEAEKNQPSSPKSPIKFGITIIDLENEKLDSFFTLLLVFFSSYNILSERSINFSACNICVFIHNNTLKIVMTAKNIIVYAINYFCQLM